jgi:hypothetical protein
MAALTAKLKLPNVQTPQPRRTISDPKPMVKIRKKPILWHIIKYYKVFGFSEFIIRVNYKI